VNTITFSAAATALRCKRRYFHRHVSKLVPAVVSEELSFGKQAHEWLADADKGVNPFLGIANVTDEFARVVHEVLATRYLEFIADSVHTARTEVGFSVPLRNPATGYPSRLWTLEGKVDGLVELLESWVLHEHKTTGRLDGEYIEALTMDLQIATYAYAVREATGRPVSAVRYLIVERPLLRPTKGETVEEFEARRAALQAKSKTGKPSTASQKIAETPEEFKIRVEAWSLEKPRITEVELSMPEDDINRAITTIWCAAQDLRLCERSGVWPHNPTQCRGRFKCPYWQLCISGDSPLVAESEYRTQEPHSELDATDTL